MTRGERPEMKELGREQETFWSRVYHECRKGGSQTGRNHHIPCFVMVQVSWTVRYICYI